METTSAGNEVFVKRWMHGNEGQQTLIGCNPVLLLHTCNIGHCGVRDVMAIDGPIKERTATRG
jgi:hypothetical protein